MEIVKILVCLSAAVCVFGGSAYAGPPLTGTYKSEFGEVSHGRHTESFANNGDFLSVGNAINGASWDGATLGAQWTIRCPDIVSTTILLDTVSPVTGNGVKLYMKSFNSGSFILNGTGEAWDGGDPEYAGVVDTYLETVSIIFKNFQRVSANVNVAWAGHFEGALYPCVQWSANGAALGDTSDGELLPSDFPAFLAPVSCDPDRSYGIWWQMTDVTMTIFGCAVPTGERTDR